jgi:hypothetical protein
MIPATFEQVNTEMDPPKGMTEKDVLRIPAFLAEVRDPSSCLDGSHVVIVAWKPSIEELKKLMEGGSIFLTAIGSLPPHYMSASFEAAIQGFKE